MRADKYFEEKTKFIFLGNFIRFFFLILIFHKQPPIFKVAQNLDILNVCSNDHLIENYSIFFK